MLLKCKGIIKNILRYSMFSINSIETHIENSFKSKLSISKANVGDNTRGMGRKKTSDILVNSVADLQKSRYRLLPWWLRC